VVVVLVLREPLEPLSLLVPALPLVLPLAPALPSLGSASTLPEAPPEAAHWTSSGAAAAKARVKIAFFHMMRLLRSKGDGRRGIHLP
jgi:hypothetical protein